MALSVFVSLRRSVVLMVITFPPSLQSLVARALLVPLTHLSALQAEGKSLECWQEIGDQQQLLGKQKHLSARGIEVGREDSITESWNHRIQ